MFIDLSLRPAVIDHKINRSIKKIMSHNSFIMGKEIMQLEDKLKNLCNAKYAIVCSSGTDALIMALMSLNIQKNDVVFVPSFTFTSTAESVVLAGGTPFFIDILEESFNIDPESLEIGIQNAIKSKYNIKCIIAVDLFGRPCDHYSIEFISKKYNIPIIIDAAQSFGASYCEHKVGSLGMITTTSFFPTKPLGCFGDGGAVFTNDDKTYNIIKSLRQHGEGHDKYHNIRIGINGRLDTMQAAVLLNKLPFLKKEIGMRTAIANYYNDKLKRFFKIPIIPSNIKSSWAQYSLILKTNSVRTELRNYLEKKSISTNIYYHTPLHEQEAYKNFPRVKAELAVSSNLSKTILNLPIYPYMKKTTLNTIIFHLLNYFN